MSIPSGRRTRPLFSHSICPCTKSLTVHDIVVISFPYRPWPHRLERRGGTQDGTHSGNQKRARRTADHDLERLHGPGHRLGAGRLRALAAVPGRAYGRSGSVTGLVTHHRHLCSAVYCRAAVPGRAIHAAAKRGRAAAIVRQLSGHDAGGGAARHQPVLHATQGVAARAQPRTASG